MNNFHTHTKRCNHAVGNEEDYVQQAIKSGYKHLGFSDHMPLPPSDNEANHRMTPYEVDDYVTEVLRLKEKYKDQIEIYLAFEFEYFENRTEWVDQLIEKYPLDYTIVGNHYYNKVSNGSYFGTFDEDLVLEKYYETSKFILESNKFDIFAHPDLFMDSYPDWDEDTIRLSQAICELAKKNNVILEYNLAGVKNDRQYPYENFWDIAIKEGCKIIIGVDAHSPMDFHLDYHQKAIDDLTKRGANLILNLKA